MSLRLVLVLGSALGLATLAACSDRPLPAAADGPPRAAPQIAGSSVVDGFTITLIPLVPGGGFHLPRRIDDDGTVYGQFENPELPGLNYWRWTAAGGTEPVDQIPPDLAGVDEDRAGQFFYDDGTVRNVVGRACGHAGSGDPAFESPDFCDFEFALGTYATSNCLPSGPEPGIHSAGFAVNAVCHVLASRRPYGIGTEAVYLWRPESGWQHLLDDPVVNPFDRFFGMPLLNNADQAVIFMHITNELGFPSAATVFWSQELGARRVPTPANDVGVRANAFVAALNDRGQMTGFVEGQSESASVLATVVWTPPAVDRSGFPTVDLTPKAKSTASTFRLAGKRAYKLFYQLGATDGGAPWQVRVEWGDGTETLSTHTQTGKLEHESHRYSAPGAYVIRVTVVDALDRSTSDSYTLEVVR